MPSPDQIGRYRVERRLGSGAFAVVWLAHDDRLHAPVAVKVMADNWAYRVDIRERFLAEARLLRKATAGGVVQVFDIGELDDERPYFVMEYADRGTVEDRIKAGPVPVPEALRLVAEVTRGVRALHETGVVHRDIKPSNVLLAGGGAAGRERVLVADLGLAKNLAQASGLTVVAGSVGYMAPEQAEPYDGIDARADVYSLGAVLHHLLTGMVPDAPGRSPRVGRVRPGVPTEVEQAVLRAMAPDREQRWPTAGAFADELDRLAERFADLGDGPSPVWPGAGAATGGGAGPASGSGAGELGDDTTRLKAADVIRGSSIPMVPGSESRASQVSESEASRAEGSTVPPAPPGTETPAGPAGVGIPGAGFGGTEGSGAGSAGTGAAGAGAVGAGSAGAGYPGVGASGGEPSEAARSVAEASTAGKSAAGTGATAAPGAPDVSAGSGMPGTPGVPGGSGMSGAPAASGVTGVGESGAPPGPSAAAQSPAGGPAGSGAPGGPAGPSGAAEQLVGPGGAPSQAKGKGGSTGKRRRGKALVFGAVAVVLLGGGGVLASRMVAQPEPGPVRVKDATKRISVEVPAVWAKESADTGWRPASIGLPGKQAPGLTVAQNVNRWQDLTAGVSGVFVGAAAPPAKGAGKGLIERVAAIEHNACSYAGSRSFRSSSWQGSIRTWSSCDSPGHSLEEIGLKPKDGNGPQVYVQIRCDGDCTDRTDDVLESLQVRER